MTTLADELDYNNGDVSLREAINSANGSVGANETITFQAGLNSEITLTHGQLATTDAVTCTDPAPAS